MRIVLWWTKKIHVEVKSSYLYKYKMFTNLLYPNIQLKVLHILILIK